MPNKVHTYRIPKRSLEKILRQIRMAPHLKNGVRLVNDGFTYDAAGEIVGGTSRQHLWSCYKRVWKIYQGAAA